MVAAGICSRGKTRLHVIEPKATVTTAYYLDKIMPIYKEATSDKTLFPKNKVTFQQDGAPAHSSNRAMADLTGSYEVVWGRGVWPETLLI
jgi:hypothetical protein